MVQLIKEAQKVDANKAPLCTLDFIIIIIKNLFIVGRLANFCRGAIFKGRIFKLNSYQGLLKINARFPHRCSLKIYRNNWILIMCVEKVSVHRILFFSLDTQNSLN